MLQWIGLDKAINKISDDRLKFSPIDFTYAQVWMLISNVYAPYQLNDMNLCDMATFINVPKAPLKDDIYGFYKNITEDESEAFVDELARCYHKAGLIDCDAIFFDQHTIPYYGKAPIGKVYHSTRNMPIKGIHLAQLNDFNGKFILFKLIPSTSGFSDILIELLKRMKRVLDIESHLLLVVDREAESVELFQELVKGGIYITVVITKNSKVTTEMESIPESDFTEELSEDEKIIEREMPLKDLPFRAGVILNENGKRYGFRTTIPKELIADIKMIAGFIPARWRQENAFEGFKNGENGDKFAGYGLIDEKGNP
jgi:hypothetical protein